MIEPARTERAACHDCAFVDEARGARGRGALHAKATGHQVTTALETTWPRRGAPPGSVSLPGLEAPAGTPDPFPDLDTRPAALFA